LLRELIARLPAYARLYWRLLRQGNLSGGQRALVLGALAYTVSPIDLVPGIIPVLGQIDDIAVALVGLRIVLRSMPRSEAEAHLAAAGLSLAQVDADLATLGVSVAALGRHGLRLASMAAQKGLRGLAAGIRRVAGGERPSAS
jgi:uncharacterized membrane protein YkvA (DUF1232 family)